MKRIAALGCVLLLSLAGLASAQPAPAAQAPLTAEQEAHYRELIHQLRCLVCQNQTIADSNAELAQDLRRQVREQIEQGRTDAEIISFMVQRYGDFVLYKPPMKPATFLLWVGPFLLLGLALALALRLMRRRRRTMPATNPDPAALKRLLDEES